MTASPPNPHAGIDAENRERDRQLAALIRRRPEIIARGQENLRRWETRWGSLNAAWQEWSVVLRILTPAQLADFLESSTPKANRLRQSSPFLGILDEKDSHAAGAT